MATILQEVQDAGLECGLVDQAEWLSSSDDTTRNLVRMIPAIASDLLDRHDWSGAARTVTVPTTAEVTSYTLPTDFLRLQRTDNAVYEVNPNRRPVMPVPADGDWNEMTAWGYAGAQRFYRRAGSTLEFYRPLPIGATVKIAYVSDQWITGGGNDWTDISQVAVFPSMLLRYGLIWRWRRQKGMRYADELAEFEARLSRAIAEDRPRRSFGYGAANSLPHPMRVPIPDYIGPSS